MKAIFKKIKKVEASIQESITAIENMNKWNNKTAQDFAEIEAEKVRLEKSRQKLLKLIKDMEWVLETKRANLEKYVTAA